ncbi:cob(I)yrinic acid a,c-diamide adenosyltransferase [Candidatus Parcubacteria bacterium]|jgi:cob(I)alamin adenosyltransferase|nr:MAG: cob(I)yrinic acid a,c-diamide adenosyltransferase [Candidatus Parcubacteria bacterium]
MNTKFFTGSGDTGSVIIGKKNKKKSDPCFDVLGFCDEVNVCAGYAALVASPSIKKFVLRIQEILFIVQAEIASLIFGGKAPHITSNHIKELEMMIEVCDKEIPPIKNFIIPGGSEASLRMEVARVRSRTFERLLVGIEDDYAISPDLKTFSNRLSSVFFAFARYENRKRGIEEKNPSYK